MSEIILNEKAAAMEALENRTLGKSPAKTLMRVAKYYYADGYKQSEIRQLLEQFMLRCNPDIRLGRWDDVLEYCSRHAGKRPLVEIEGIGITKKEFEIIGTVDGGMSQRVLFTLLCLAKLGNATSSKNNNWVNREHREIFSLANSEHLDQKRRCNMLRNMWSLGLIDFSKIVDNTNIRVMIVDNDSPVALWVKDFRNLGNQYRMHHGESYMECENCGLVVRRTSNASNFCKNCGDERHRSWRKIAKIKNGEK